MLPVRFPVAFILTFALFPAAVALAGDSPEDIKQRIGTGNPVAGKEKSAVCQGCHGEDGNSAVPEFPKLAGQYAVYIQKQIRDFKKGLRKDPVMSDMAASIANEQDLLDISAYFASQKQMRGAAPVVNKRAQDRFLSSNGCAICHGANGKGLAPNDPSAPVIGGQHKEYLVKQLKDFKNRTRNNEFSGMMAVTARSMTDAEIEEIASYVSGM